MLNPLNLKCNAMSSSFSNYAPAATVYIVLDSLLTSVNAL